ncbi:DNA polymerase III subunit chi [Undibacterium sp. CY18W]|uniref:DNA polymerase III subunit chi n=1 Tax=Undibacterium hunanense TaxID=2762292 RepID=A0ABR6ZS94_9BURK|nr:DNA polymerase III subunit chi [Undibacterium hunanense]MBC3918756.1 DNA polymerase III subunit chi [Undibacterium hunanense]
MTRIDFHSNVADKLNYTCRLIRKAHAAKSKMVVFHHDRVFLQKLSMSLWTLTEADFLPHVMLTDPLSSCTPIVLSYDDRAACPHYDVLINLTAETPANFTQFQRMIEVISAEDVDKLAGRERYRQYQQQGYPLTHSVAK